MLDKFFQFVLNLINFDKINNKFKKKIFYIFFSLLKFTLNGPFVVKFKKFKLFTYPNKINYSTYIFTRGDLPDPAERKIIVKNLLGEKNIFIDCGANIGFYTIFVASEVNNCEIFSFEPSEKQCEYLKHNISLNQFQNVKTIKKAVGNYNGTIFFNESKGGFVSKNPSSKKNYEVEIVKLETFFESYNFENSKIFIKIDLEGFDLEAIYGAQKLLDKYDVSILFEFSRMITNNQNYSISKFESFLKKNNLKLFDITGNKIEAIELEKKIALLPKSHDTCGNFVICKKKINFSY